MNKNGLASRVITILRQRRQMAPGSELAKYFCILHCCHVSGKRLDIPGIIAHLMFDLLQYCRRN
jgi:hypothetical protein